MESRRNTGRIIDLVLKAVALGTAIAVVVLNII